jgi:predicted DCC family thiol-disulfide oxidoreductase YuxK
MKESSLVILYDGHCNLCNRALRFVIRRDAENKFQYASLESAAAISLISGAVIDKQAEDSIVYVEDKKIYLRSTAVLRILKKMGRGWQFFYILMLIPRFIRDPLYDVIAVNRHRWFGRSKDCFILSNDQQYHHNSEQT